MLGEEKNMKCKKNWIIGGKDSLFFLFLLIIFTIVFNLLVVNVFRKENKDISLVIVEFILHFISAALFILVLFFLNKRCNLVYFFDDSLERRGLFFGFKKKLDIKSIKKIEKITFPRDGTYYLLQDGNSSCIERTGKNAGICIPYTQKGDEFIKLFWKGEITIYM